MPLRRRQGAMSACQRAMNELAGCGDGFAGGACDVRVVGLEYLAQQNDGSLLETDAAKQFSECSKALLPHRNRMFEGRLCLVRSAHPLRCAAFEVCALQPFAAKPVDCKIADHRMQPCLHRLRRMLASAAGAKVGILNRVFRIRLGAQQAARDGKKPLPVRVAAVGIGAIAHAERLPPPTAIRVVVTNWPARSSYNDQIEQEHPWSPRYPPRRPIREACFSKRRRSSHERFSFLARSRTSRRPRPPDG